MTDPRQGWHLRDSSRKLVKAFGLRRGLWRCHAALQRVIWLALEGDVEHVIAFACQASKALHQVAMDKGDCSKARPMIPVADILQELQYGREKVEMRMIHSSKKARREIKSQHTTRETPKNDRYRTGAGQMPGGCGLLSLPSLPSVPSLLSLLSLLSLASLPNLASLSHFLSSCAPELSSCAPMLLRRRW